MGEDLPEAPYFRHGLEVVVGFRHLLGRTNQNALDRGEHGHLGGGKRIGGLLRQRRDRQKKDGTTHGKDQLGSHEETHLQHQNATNARPGVRERLTSAEGGKRLEGLEGEPLAADGGVCPTGGKWRHL